jgi:S-DNA-T family DNA segregation ATPase FtsK/SpoIIIE
MRRHARQIRRSGMQPMMVINSGDHLPETAGIFLVRWFWRYRSELAPLYLAAIILGAAWWMHAYHPQWWEFILSIAAVAAWALATFGARIGVPALIERLYLATTTVAVGGWITAATALGPIESPLPQVLTVGGLALSVPW